MVILRWAICGIVCSSQAGDLTVQPTLSPMPPTKESTLEATITDARGKPVTKANVVFDLSMPGMTMGEQRVKARSQGDGRYTAQGNFSMSGTWSIQVRVVHGGKRKLAEFTVEAKSPCTLAFHSNREGGIGIYLIKEDGSGLRKLTDGPMDNNPAFAPDGRMLTFDRDEDIYRIQVDGTGLQNLTRYEAANACSWWSGQGDQLAFQTNRDGHFEVYAMLPDGTGVSRLTRDTANNACPAFARDARRIAFVSDRHGTMDLFTIGMDGTGERRLTAETGNNMDPAWSPDGSNLAFVSDREGRFEVYLTAHDGTNQRRLTQGAKSAVQPAFSPDGTRIAYERGGHLFIITTDGTGERQLTTGEAYHGGPSWDPRCR